MMPATTAALASNPVLRRILSLTTLDSRRLDRSDQLVELGGRVADIFGQISDHLDRLLRLPDFHQLVDKILVRLQHLQQSSKLRPGVAKLLGGVLGLRL